ncbi:MarR family transcriptional regulator [Paenibacillus aurantius]|uniref:MarR family transcriptional regulator n=1 Tax=Paenibacillus aurantius TaxID=2918900 RepID=A0AA96LFF1_9BACL|nr:MarR family transcriptional regulator [Paenibacillus aurantius]WNQ12048.1 MarR family transcriptional regulator [Paenibacillus aurantius]
MQSEWQRGLADINRSQAVILEKLEAEGPQKASSLAEALYMTSGAITGLSDKLIEDGFAERYRDEKDRRVVYLAITEKGRSKLESIRDYRHKLYHSLFSGLSTEEIQGMTNSFQRILSNIEENRREE